MSHFIFKGESELCPLVPPRKEEESLLSGSTTNSSARGCVSVPFRDLDDLILGGCSLSDFLSPLASVWSLRHALVFRLQGGIFSRVVDFEIKDDKVRVVGILPLKLLPGIRANRAVTVLSDGSVFLLNL